jgi:hypothetical protein
MTAAITRRTWIRPLLTWKAKNPNAHAITRMIKIVSSILTSFFIFFSSFSDIMETAMTGRRSN